MHSGGASGEAPGGWVAHLGSQTMSLTLPRPAARSTWSLDSLRAFQAQQRSLRTAPQVDWASGVTPSVGSLANSRSSTASSDRGLQQHLLRPQTRGQCPRSPSSGLDIKPWEIPFEDLELVEAVGEGSFGRVRACSTSSWGELGTTAPA